MEKDLRSFIPVFTALLGARALLLDFPFCWAGMFLLSSVHSVFQGKGTVPENNISLTGGLWAPGIRNILVSRLDRDGRGADSPVPLAEDVLHSLCQEPPAPLAPCPLSVPFLLLIFARCSSLSEVRVMPAPLTFFVLLCQPLPGRGSPSGRLVSPRFLPISVGFAPSCCSAVSVPAPDSACLCLFQCEAAAFEERQYPAGKWACVTMGEPLYEQSISMSFMKLMRYICKENSVGVCRQGLEGLAHCTEGRALSLSLWTGGGGLLLLTHLSHCLPSSSQVVIWA